MASPDRSDIRCGGRACAAIVVAMSLVGCAEIGDRNVAVTSTANRDYSRQKFGESVAPKPETYVFMQGEFFPSVTVDPTLDRLTFRQLAEMLAPHLARQQYWPAKDAKNADLLLMVHWGVTTPSITLDESRGRDLPAFDSSRSIVTHTVGADETPAGFASDVQDFLGDVPNENDVKAFWDDVERQQDMLAARMASGGSIRLLGYGRHLQALSQRGTLTTAEATLRSDLASERYFVIVCAYDLRQVQSPKPKILWTLHLNVRSPGHNFTEALSLMSEAAVSYFGRQTDEVETVTPKLRQGRVTIGDVTIVGESK